MKISFRCPQCNKRLSADLARAGRAATCPRCSTTLTVPADSSSPSPDADAPRDADATSGAKPASEHALLLVRPVQAHREELIDMTAMVDIVFFLLIFFLVTSMQSLQAVIGLPKPQAQASAATSVTNIASDPNYITVTIYEDDAVWVEDEQVFGAQDLRTRLRAARQDEPLLDGMRVVGAPDASHGTFVMVLDAGADAGMSELMFSVTDQIDEITD
jgi:biopolymer transport protein ExbD